MVSNPIEIVLQMAQTQCEDDWLMGNDVITHLEYDWLCEKSICKWGKITITVMGLPEHFGHRVLVAYRYINSIKHKKGSLDFGTRMP